jgi:hypothetical protein
MTIHLDGTKAELLSRDPMVVKNLKNWYHIHTYGGWSRFFQGLQEGKLLGTRCPNAACSENRIFIPPRADCQDCWARTEWVEVPPVGKIYTFSTVTYPGELFRAKPPVPLISEAAQRVLEHHSWPGNTRELENVIHFALLVSSGDEILPEHLNLPVVDSPLEQVRRIYAQASPAEQATLRQFLHEQNGIST